jgi:iron-sulfur cluster assembly protein
MAISVTPAAAERIQNFIAARGHGLGLKLGVRKTGCSGFAYVVKLIDGTTVDFVRQGLNEAFRFQNPNIKGECGCGESFNV